MLHDALRKGRQTQGQTDNSARLTTVEERASSNHDLSSQNVMVACLLHSAVGSIALRCVASVFHRVFPR